MWAWAGGSRLAPYLALFAEQGRLTSACKPPGLTSFSARTLTSAFSAANAVIITAFARLHRFAQRNRRTTDAFLFGTHPQMRSLSLTILDRRDTCLAFFRAV